MLFNSYEFILFFLPVTLLVFFRIGGQARHKLAMLWLVCCSLFFYAWWNPAYLGLILASILFNYAVGIILGSHPEGRRKKTYLTLGIGCNLALLAYYKYAGFFVENVNNLTGTSFNPGVIALPLAISFFTFQQIAYLVDAYRSETREYNFLHYSLFVTFFPQLIAGPIVHHKEMLPQFGKNAIYRANDMHIAVGLTIFVIGLFKKVVMADGVAAYATPVFSAAEKGAALGFQDAWLGTLAYTLQLYFDFSGYSDMAIGLARMFGIRLPLNFNSPYKAHNIIEFWRRWHITLSRFLRDYLYIPLGGNRKGKLRRHVNLMVVMLLGGLWHGAGWTFVIWGALHGAYLIINHAWHTVKRLIGLKSGKTGNLGKNLSRAITFLAVAIAWVFFRSDSLAGATNMLSSMTGAGGIAGTHIVPVDALYWIGALLAIAWLAPNTQQMMRRYKPALETYRGEIEPTRMELAFSAGWAGLVSILAIYSLIHVSTAGEFLYFNF